MTASPVKVWLGLALSFVGLYGGYTGWRLYKLDRERAAAGYGAAEYKPPEDLDYPVGPFELTERSGEKFNSKALEGKVWVASFFFTGCPGPCVRMNNFVAELQQDAAYRDAMFVSVTVDPDNDTPERLRTYADHYRADAARWVFLTGEMRDIERLAIERFKVPFARAMHSERLMLVDRQGRVRGAYSATDPAEVLLLKRKLAKLLEEPS